MKEIHDEGIILSQNAFGENEQIIKFFSLKNGLISTFAKARQIQAKGLSLSCVDLLLREGKGQLYQLRELRWLDFALDLRQSLEKLECAGKMIRSLFLSQAEKKPAPQLYLLFKKYLERLSKSSFAEAISTSFYCKLLRHEGLLFNLQRCQICAKPLEELYLFEGQSFCEKDKKDGAVFFTPVERKLLEILAFSRKAEDLETEVIKSLVKKIEAFFFEQYEFPKSACK